MKRTLALFAVLAATMLLVPMTVADTTEVEPPPYWHTNYENDYGDRDQTRDRLQDGSCKDATEECLLLKNQEQHRYQYRNHEDDTNGSGSHGTSRGK